MYIHPPAPPRVFLRDGFCADADVYVGASNSRAKSCVRPGRVFAFNGLEPLARSLAASLDASGATVDGAAQNAGGPRPLWSLVEGARTLLRNGTIAVFDADGDAIDVEEIVDALREIRLAKTIRRLQFANVQKNKDRYVFRDGPVPYTRKRRGGGGWFRYPRTRREIAASRALERDEDLAEIGIAPRQTGRLRRLSTFWDDIPRRNDARSWKRHRARQWERF